MNNFNRAFVQSEGTAPVSLSQGALDEATSLRTGAGISSGPHAFLGFN